MMFLRIAGLMILQVIFYRGHCVEACTNDSECHCPDRNSHGRCVDFKEDNKGHFCVCDPVHCNPNPCPNRQICVNSIFLCRDRCNITCHGQTICVAFYDHHHYYCIEPCDANPCSSKQTCVRTNHSPYYECKGPCDSHPCPSTLACIPRNNTHFDCKDQCYASLNCPSGQCVTTVNPKEHRCVCQAGHPVSNCYDPHNNHTTTRTTHPSTTKVASTSRATDPSTTDAASTSRATSPSTTDAASTSRATEPSTTDAASSSRATDPSTTDADSTSRATDPSTTDAASTSRATDPSTTDAASTSRATEPSTSDAASTSRATEPSTSDAASTSSTEPTPAHNQSDCSEFDVQLHGCHDNSACILPHVLEVICPDPKEAKYCPTTCGCCPKVPLLG